MTAADATIDRLRALPWRLWVRQVAGILRLELKRHFLGRRSLLVYLLALLPVVLLSLRFIAPDHSHAVETLGGTSVLYAIIFRSFFLRLVLFFGCVGIFMNLFRGEVLERTLHFYLLTPIRREVMVVGKFAAGVIVCATLFGLSTLFSYLLMFAPSGWPALEQYVLNGPGLAQLGAYLGITLFACVGYGGLFLLLGLFFRNPIVPAGAVLGWEYLNFLLPPLLKKFSVIYYLESLCPVPVPEGPINLLSEPAPLWLSGPGLLLLTALALLIASLRLRWMEISYGED